MRFTFALVLALAAPAFALFQHTGLVTDIPLTSWMLFPSNSSPATFEPVPVAVPSTVVGALVQSGYYAFDPFYGENLKRINEADFDSPWTYSTSFNLPVMSFDAVAAILYFDGINYRGNVTLNGVMVANETVAVGALQRFEFDVTQIASWTLPNNLSVSIRMPSRDPGQWRNANPDLSLSFDDWAPHPPDLNMGLWRPVGIRIVRAAPTTQQSLFTFEGFALQTSLESVESSDGSTSMTAYLNFSVVAKFWGSAPINASFFIDLSSLLGVLDPELFVRHASFVPGAGTEVRLQWTWVECAPLTVSRPPLWWPWQMHSDRPFFNATVGTVVNATRYDGAIFRYALREVTSTLTAGGSLQLYVNDVPLNLRSGGWAPDLFQRTFYDRLVTDFVMIREMGLNAIRLEGMMMNEDFFDLADEVGVLVTPGFGCCDGWQHWARWPAENYQIAPESARKQARRLESHPSVVAFFLASDSLPPVNVEVMYRNVFAEEAWPNVLISSASQQSSYVSGQSGVKMVGPYSWVPPSYWLEDGDGLTGNGTMNYGGAWGFLTEGGPGEAPMTFNSWQRTVPEAHLWNETTKSMDEWWSFHMGCPFGHFRNLTYYSPPLNARYGESHNAQTYLFRSQAANLEGIRSMYEAYTRNKHINATGVVQWQIKAAWPNHLWHLYDWYFVSGGGYYGAKRALEHVHAMFSYTDGSVWLINSNFDDVCGDIMLAVEVLLLDGTQLWFANTTVSSLPPDASIDVTAVMIPLSNFMNTLPPKSTFFVKLTWFTTCATAPVDVPRVDNPATNWYWLSTQPDSIDWADSNGFRTPCSQWADFDGLNSLPSTNLTVSHSVSLSPPSALSSWTESKAAVFAETPTVKVTIHNSGPSVAFLIHVRLLNITSNHDIAPALCDDNFFSLAPSETHTIHCAIVGCSQADLNAHAKLVVETYNDVVSST